MSKKIDIKDVGKEINKFVKEQVDKLEKGAKKVEKATNKKIDKKVDKLKAYRKEASKMVSMANKRLRRLEKNKLQDNPAYQGYLKSGGNYFSVKGKDYNQLQSEVARMKAFIDAKTSTVKGTNDYLKGIAKDTGIQYKSMVELRAKAGKFFELASKTEQYLRTVEDMASAIGYQKIWTAINTYTKSAKIDLASSETNIDDMIDEITKALVEFERPITIDYSPMGFNEKDFYQLPKD